MAKFILVNDYGDFEKMKDYINSNRKKNYYIAPNLMYSLLSSPYRCVVGLIMDDIKVRSQDKIDIIKKSVYNKVFQREAFRVDAIKNYYLRNVVHEFEYEEIIFGTREEYESDGWHQEALEI